MPGAPQILDFGPRPYSQAAQNLGAGFAHQYLQNLQQNEEQSALDQLIGGLTPEMKEQDVLKHVLSQKGLSYENKLKATSAINEVLEQTRKRQMQKDLFGGDAERNMVDNVNVQGDMNHIPPGVDQSSMGDGGAGGPPKVVPSPEGSDARQTRQGRFSGNPRTWRDQDLLALESLDPKAAKAARELKDAAVKQWNENRKFEYARAKKFIEQSDAEEAALPILKQNLEIARNAAAGQGFLERIGNMLADSTGFENLRSAKGAQLLNASKEFLMANLSRIKGRPNQWIEQQINKAFLTTGRGDEQQALVARAFDSEFALAEEKVRLRHQIEEEYIQDPNFGYIPGNIANIVAERMKPYERQESEKLANDLQEITEKYEGYQLKEVRPGTPLTIGMANFLLQQYGDDEQKALEKARKLGYTIPRD